MPKPPPTFSTCTGAGAAAASRIASSTVFSLSLADRLGLQVLRAAVDVKALEGEAAAADLLEQRRHGFRVHAELLGTAAHLHAGRLQLEVRVDANCDARADAGRVRQAREDVDLARRFDVDENAGRERLRELAFALRGGLRS
jgi:hypothetical protein